MPKSPNRVGPKFQSISSMANSLEPGETLALNQSLTSPSGVWQLSMQMDGNLVLYRAENMQAVWATNTNGQDVQHAVMQQTDGNFVLYLFNGQPAWASDTAGNPGARLILQDDGNLVVYLAQRAIWSTGTHS
jgi:hypothetical protein